MDEEDDMIMVIIGDEEKQDSSSSMEIKEVSNETLGVEELIQTAEKYGEFIGDIQVNVKGKPLESQDINYEPEREESESDEEIEEKKIHRHKLLRPSECKSFVEELRQTYPELKDNAQLLVESLAEIMRNVKPPPPPRDYFIMNNINFECVKCSHQSETTPAASRHWQEKHGERYLICYSCGVDFRSTTNLYKHEKRCRGSDAAFVLRARARTLGARARQRPYLQPRGAPAATLKPPWLCCEQCPARFGSRTALTSHRLMHAGIRPFVCHQCTAAYTSKSALTRHLTMHKDEEFICDHCQRAFKRKAALVAHIDTHNPVRKFPCSECTRRYASRMALRLHTHRLHRGLPPPCACQLCPRRYPRMSLLKTHMLKKHGMNLVTRKMFFKLLPTLKTPALELAKVILKSDSDPLLLPAPETLENMKPVPSEHSHESMAENETIEDQIQIKQENIANETEDDIEIKQENNTEDQEAIDVAQEVLQYLEEVQNGDGKQEVKVVYVWNKKVIAVSLEDKTQLNVSDGKNNDTENESYKDQANRNIVIEVLPIGNENIFNKDDTLQEIVSDVNSIENLQGDNVNDWPVMRKALKDELTKFTGNNSN